MTRPTFPIPCLFIIGSKLSIQRKLLIIQIRSHLLGIQSLKADSFIRKHVLLVVNAVCCNVEILPFTALTVMLHQTFIDLSTRQFLDYFIQTRSFAFKLSGFPSHSFWSQEIYSSIGKYLRISIIRILLGGIQYMLSM